LVLLVLGRLARMLARLRRGPARVEAARDGGVRPCWVAPVLLLLLLLLLLRWCSWARGVGVSRVGRLTASGLRGGRLLLAAPHGILRWAWAVAPAAERLVVLVVRVRGHTYRGALRFVDGGPAGLTEAERVGLLLAWARSWPGVVVLLLRERAADGWFRLDTAMLSTPC
jgi:hypothetical protein